MNTTEAKDIVAKHFDRSPTWGDFMYEGEYFNAKHSDSLHDLMDEMCHIITEIAEDESKEIEGLKSEVEDLEMKIEDLGCEKDKLSERIEELEDEVEELETTLREKESGGL